MTSVPSRPTRRCSSRSPPSGWTVVTSASVPATTSAAKAGSPKSPTCSSTPGQLRRGADAAYDRAHGRAPLAERGHGVAAHESVGSGHDDDGVQSMRPSDLVHGRAGSDDGGHHRDPERREDQAGQHVGRVVGALVEPRRGHDHRREEEGPRPAARRGHGADEVDGEGAVDDDRGRDVARREAVVGHEAGVEDLDRRPVAGDQERHDEVEREGAADEHAEVDERAARALRTPEHEGRDRRDDHPDDGVGEVAAPRGERRPAWASGGRRTTATTLSSHGSTVDSSGWVSSQPTAMHAEREEDPHDRQGAGVVLRAPVISTAEACHPAPRPAATSGVSRATARRTTPTAERSERAHRPTGPRAPSRAPRDAVPR